MDEPAFGTMASSPQFMWLCHCLNVMQLLGQHPESMCYYWQFIYGRSLIESLHTHAHVNSDIPKCMLLLWHMFCSITKIHVLMPMINTHVYSDACRFVHGCIFCFKHFLWNCCEIIRKLSRYVHIILAEQQPVGR